MKYQIIAYVRKRGAIGVFYTQSFIVESGVKLDREGLKNAWFSQFSNQWELNHFLDIELAVPQ